MRLRIRPGAVVVVAAALLAVSIGARSHVPIVHAAQTWHVQVGADLGDAISGGGTQTGIGYYPHSVTIGAGDSVSWSFPAAEPHTVTFDNGHLPPLFAEGFAPVMDGSGDFEITAAALPRGSDGVTAMFNPAVQLSSGIPQDPSQTFTVTFPAPGVFNYICAIHGPSMTAVVTVEPAGSALAETPAQEQARGQADLGFAEGVAQEGLSGNAFPINSPPLAIGGADVPSVVVGYQPSTNIAALAFFPANVTVHQGGTVVFAAPDFQEVHTVSFLAGNAPPDLIDVVPSPAGPPKFFIRGSIAAPSGGTTFTGSAPVNTGFLFPGNTVAITFNAAPGTYQYVCLLHGGAPQNMQGTITVVP